MYFQVIETIPNQGIETTPMNFRNIFQNLMNLLISRIYPFFSDSTSSEILSFGHSSTKLSPYFVFLGLSILQNVEIKKTLNVHFQQFHEIAKQTI